MRSAGVMSAVQGVLTLITLTLVTSSASATDGGDRWASTTPPQASLSSSYPRPSIPLLPDSCTPDIEDLEAYKTNHPMCYYLAAQKKRGLSILPPNCVTVRGQPMNVTLYWSTDTTRAASALLAAVLRHVYKVQRVHLAPDRKDLAQIRRPNEIVIKLAAVVQDGVPAMTDASDRLEVIGASHIPTRRKLHAWLKPPTDYKSDCHNSSWTFYTNMTALALCGFIEPVPPSAHVPNSVPMLTVFGVGDESNTTMQKLPQRAKAVGLTLRSIFVNRTVFQHNLLTSNYSFLFLDFDIWQGKPNIRVMEAPCLPNRDGVCGPELDNSIAMLVTDNEMNKTGNIFKLITHLKPTPEVLRMILDQEANGVDLEGAACEWAAFHSFNSFGLSIPYKTVLRRIKVAICLCKADPNNSAYDTIVRTVGAKLFKKKPLLLRLIFVRYYMNCSDPYYMSKSLKGLVRMSRADVLGVVSMTVEGAEAASATAASLRVPLMLAGVVPDEYAAGNTTWQVAGRLRHITLAIQHMANEFGWTRVAVLSQPTTFAQRYLAELEDQTTFSLKKIEVPLNVTVRLAEEVLQDLRVTKSRVVLVNTNSDAADLILATAVKLNMTYRDGFIWILREPQSKAECTTGHFTVSLYNRVLKDFPNRQPQTLFQDGVDRPLWPLHSVSFADALMTVSKSYINIFKRHPDMLIDLNRNDIMRSFEDSLKEEPATGINGDQLHYKERAIEETFVYLDEWCQSNDTHKSQRLATWRVNAMSGVVRDKYDVEHDMRRRRRSLRYERRFKKI